AASPVAVAPTGPAGARPVAPGGGAPRAAARGTCATTSLTRAPRWGRNSARRSLYGWGDTGPDFFTPRAAAVGSPGASAPGARRPKHELAPEGRQYVDAFMDDADGLIHAGHVAQVVPAHAEDRDAHAGAPEGALRDLAAPRVALSRRVHESSSGA